MKVRDDQNIVDEVVRSKVKYAVSLLITLRKRNHSKELGSDIDNIWKISGFKNKKIFEKHFKLIMGFSVKNYIKSLPQRF